MDKSLMLKQIKEHHGIKSDAEFARYLGISTANMYTWLKRSTYDPTVILAKCQDISADWLLTGEGEMIKKPEPPTEDPAQNVSDNVMIPREAWEVIRDQAASLKAKDEQMNEMIAGYKEKDRQINDVIAMLNEQIKKGEGVDENGHAAPGAAIG